MKLIVGCCLCLFLILNSLFHRQELVEPIIFNWVEEESITNCAVCDHTWDIEFNQYPVFCSINCREEWRSSMRYAPYLKKWDTLR